MQYIKLNFQAPIMAFGDATTAYQNVRDTATHPTKSMVAGLIACAMGIGREDARAQQIANTITVYSTSLNRRGALWQDYQNAHMRKLNKQGEYGHRDDANVQRWKTYITNGRYVVFVGCEDSVELERIYDSLSRPYWPIFAGRKCCPFAAPITEKEYKHYSRDEIELCVKDFNEKEKENVTLCICQ